ncbi:MAG: hypothetical protein FWF72_05735 [Paludibacter sp.]|nr:hypothetical protein [Paludibacter sp.]
MTKKFFLAGCFIALIGSASLNAQVGVNTETPAATFDVVAKKTDGSTAEGVIAPRLTGDQLKAGDSKYDNAQNGAIVFVTAPVGSASAKTANVTKAGYYYYDAPNSVWVAIGGVSITDKWFYMPSVVFDVSTQGTGFSRNLYNEFRGQLNSTASPVVRSTGTPEAVLATVPAATDFYYYVTAYDPAVFANISINPNGVMTYDIIGTATDATFINIVFVVK